MPQPRLGELRALPQTPRVLLLGEGRVLVWYGKGRKGKGKREWKGMEGRGARDKRRGKRKGGEGSCRERRNVRVGWERKEKERGPPPYFVHGPRVPSYATVCLYILVDYL